MAERRRGGESGVQAVQCLEGKAAWEAAAAGLWDRTLLEAAFACVPGQRPGKVEEDDAQALVYRIEYRDGLQAVSYMSPRHIHDFAFAGRPGARQPPAGTSFPSRSAITLASWCRAWPK
jgi:hypothetical protein